MVTCHQNPILNSVLTSFRYTQFLQYCTKIDLELLTNPARKIMFEMERVSKEEGVIIVYPALDVIEDYLGDFLKEKKIKFVNQKIEGLDPSMGIISDGCEFYEDCSSSILYRTIFFKESILDNLSTFFNL